MEKKCPKCGLTLSERITDPIFQKKEYYCAVCEQATKTSLSKHKEQKLKSMIIEEIERLWDFRLDIKQNYEKFCKFSKLKLSFEKYRQILTEEQIKNRKI